MEIWGPKHLGTLWATPGLLQDSLIFFSDALISQIYFGMKLYMFRTVPLSIIRSLFTVHSAMVYVVQVCRQLSTNLYDNYHC